jgi:hypothetical protein
MHKLSHKSVCGTRVQKFRRILAHTMFICAGHVIPGIWNYPCASLVTSLIATSMAPPIPLAPKFGCCPRVSRNLEKKFCQRRRRRRNFSKFATNRSTCLPGTRSTHVPEKHGIRCINGSRSLGGLRQCLTSDCLATILRPKPPTAPPRCAPRAARSARSSGTTLDAPAPPHPRRARSVSFDTSRARPPMMGRLHASRIHGAVSNTSSQKRSLR